MSPVSLAPPTEELGGAEPPNLGRVHEASHRMLLSHPRAGRVGGILPGRPADAGCCDNGQPLPMRSFGVSPGGRLWPFPSSGS